MRILLPVWLALGLLVWVAEAAAQADPKAIVVRAIEAHGGEAKLAHFNAEQAKTRGTVHVGGKSIPFIGETYVQLPSQFKSVMSYELDGKKRSMIQVLDGEKGWISFDGTTKSASTVQNGTRNSRASRRLHRSGSRNGFSSPTTIAAPTSANIFLCDSRGARRITNAIPRFARSSSISGSPSFKKR